MVTAIAFICATVAAIVLKDERVLLIGYLTAC